MEGDMLQKVEARIVELPQDIQNAILASDFDSKVQDVGKKHNLHIDQIGTLGDETMLVLLGFTAVGDFARNISTSAHISTADADALVADVGENIFLPIRESMKQFAEGRKQVPEAAPTGPSAAMATPPAKTMPDVAPMGESLPMKPDLHAAEVMLREQTVSQPVESAQKTASTPVGSSDTTPPKPVSYKADPYREPPTP